MSGGNQRIIMLVHLSLKRLKVTYSYSAGFNLTQKLCNDHVISLLYSLAFTSHQSALVLHTFLTLNLSYSNIRTIYKTNPEFSLGPTSAAVNQ